jgi:integrase
MPKHVIKKSDEIPTSDWHKICKVAAKLDYTKGHVLPPFQLWLSCILAIDWLTGKRINEILTLRRKSIFFTENEIRIKFLVGKKRSRGAPTELIPYLKARNIKHQAVPYVQAYLKEYDKKITDLEEYLFPAKTMPRTRIVKTKFTNGKGEKETRSYIYQDKGGYIYEENARRWLIKVNEKLPKSKQIYFHFGRHNIGIKLAYQGKSDIEIANVLDETPRAAISYTKHAGGLNLDWTKETE